MRTLTEKDMFRILDHECRDRHLWTLALYGLRRGEIAGLRWANVDLKAKTVSVNENRVAVGKEIMTGTPKSKASTRTLPMPDEVVEVLQAARKRQLEERLAFGSGYGSGEYVASDETGQPYHPNLAHVPLGPHARRVGYREGASTRRKTLVRDADAPTPSANRGDCGVAGPRQRSFHAVGVHAQPGRRPEGRSGQFRSSCDNS